MIPPISGIVLSPPISPDVTLERNMSRQPERLSIRTTLAQDSTRRRFWSRPDAPLSTLSAAPITVKDIELHNENALIVRLCRLQTPCSPPGDPSQRRGVPCLASWSTAAKYSSVPATQCCSAGLCLRSARLNDTERGPCRHFASKGLGVRVSLAPPL